VRNSCGDPGLVVTVYGVPKPAFGSRTDHHGGQTEVIEQPWAVVVNPHVGQEDAVDATVCGQPAVTFKLALLVADDLQYQGVSLFEQDGFDAGDEGAKEWVGWVSGGLGDHQLDGQRPGSRQRPASHVWRPAKVTGDGKDFRACLRSDAGPVIQGRRDRRFGDERHGRRR
jgi:hypothetical protein